MKSRYHRINAHHGYKIPALAIAGGSCTGDWSDSPARPNDLKAEADLFRKDVLRPAGINSRLVWGTTSNIFCGKRWIVVAKEAFQRAAELAVPWFKANDHRLRILHDANLKEVLHV